MLLRCLRPAVSAPVRPVACRAYSDSLRDPLPNVPSDKTSGAPGKLTVSTLPNGVRVASHSGETPVASVGVYVRAGSRYENYDTLGSAEFMKFMSQRSTQNLSALRVTRLLETLTGDFQVRTSPEHIAYTADLLPAQVPDVIQVLGDMMQPRLPEWEVRDMRPFVQQDAASRQAADPVKDLLHQAAYRGTTLGQPTAAPAYQFDRITHESLQEYVKNFYIGNRIGVVGVGISDHKAFEEQVKTAFASVPAAGAGAPADAPAVYVGGDAIALHGDGTRVAIAFEGSGWNSADVLHGIALANVLGCCPGAKPRPGTGVTSHLFRNVVSTNDFVRSASAFTHVYSDAALTGVQAHAAPGRAAEVAALLTGQLKAVATGATAADAARASAAVRAAFADLAATRTANLDILGSQLCWSDCAVSGEGLDQVNITAADLKAHAKKLLSSTPTVVTVGDITGAPTVDTVRAAAK